jgi:erythromycin esterase-like protein
MARHSRRVFREPDSKAEVQRAVADLALPLNDAKDLDPLVDRIGSARYVLLGEASHGTADYYDWRRRLSERLIAEKGFNFIAVEGDWPDCYRVNRYVKGRADSGESAQQVLHEFGRWPTWMWANEEAVELAEWLRGHNDNLPEQRKAGFYGLDVYSLWESMDAVIHYLKTAAPDAIDAARQAFECFEPFDYDPQEYARATMWVPETCEQEVVNLLQEIRRQAPRYEHDGREDHFNAEQNALVIRNAEHYYRTMVRGDASSWNLRDGHMVETLNRLMAHHGPDAKAIVWEHNTHVGDARYTDMADDGMFNVGQLVRQQHLDQGVMLVGFSSYRGTVIAGDSWGAPMRKMPVPPGRPGSWEEALHDAVGVNSLLLFDGISEDSPLMEARGHRAIGVVYRPQMEAYGNYVPTILPRRYDALLYLDETRALHPLHVPASFEHEVPETYPTGV